MKQAFAARRKIVRDPLELRLLAVLTLSMFNVVIPSWARNDGQNIAAIVKRTFSIFGQLAAE